MNAIKIFYSYAFSDEPLRKELEKHLTILKRQELITTWHSQEVTAGTVIGNEIKRHLNQADIILLLVSPDFLASDFCYNVEIKLAMRRHQEGQVVIPIILRPVYWENAPFGKLRALPNNGKPITSWPGRHGRDKAFLEIALALRDTIRVITTSRKDSGPRHRKRPQTTQPAPSNIPKFEIAQLWVHRAHVYFRREDYEESLAIYNQALLLSADDAIAYSGKGDVLKGLHRYKEALQAYEQALCLDPNDAVTLREKADTLYKLDRSPEALDTYEQALHLDPNDATTHRGKGDALKELHRYEEALTAYEQALRLDPNDATAYRGKGDTLKELHRYDESFNAYQQALRLDPNDVIIYKNMGKALKEQCWLNPGDTAIYRDIADALKGFFEYEMALAAYEHVLRLDPNDSIAYRGKGDVLTASFRYAEAVDAYLQAICLNQDDANTYRGMGDALAELHHYEMALTAYEHALRLNPNDFAAIQKKAMMKQTLFWNQAQ